MYTGREPTVIECALVNKPKKGPSLGQYEEELKQTCLELRRAGTIVSNLTLSAVIRAVLLKHDLSLLKSRGGAIDPVSRAIIQGC